MNPKDIIKIEGIRFYAPNKSDFIYKQMIKNQYIWEKHLVERLCQFITPDSYAVDIGAHVGNHTIQFSKRAKKVFSFEPALDTCRIFEINMQLNNINNVVLFKKAVCEHAKKFNFDPNKSAKRKRNTGATFLVEDKNGPMEGNSLDAFLSDIDAPISVIKYDAEEMELQALKGSVKILSEFGPVLYVEFIKDAKRKRGKGKLVRDFLYSIRYRPLDGETEFFVPF